MPTYAFKVVTPDMRSLGLRRNPTVITYPVGVWVPNPGPIVEGIADEGGIWAARTLGSANQYRRYMRTTHSMDVRVFYSEIGRVLFRNSGRVKTDRILLLEEITEKRGK